MFRYYNKILMFYIRFYKVLYKIVCTICLNMIIRELFSFLVQLAHFFWNLYNKRMFVLPVCLHPSNSNFKHVDIRRIVFCVKMVTDFVVRRFENQNVRWSDPDLTTSKCSVWNKEKKLITEVIVKTLDIYS
jgi:hypothetical protein